MAALCQAVETKDLYTRGHRERVSRGAVIIGREIGMRASRVEAILYAGMLHDVGKLEVPTTVLRKDGPLTEEEFAAIQLHPMRGLEIVQEIGFLSEALAGIMHGTRPGAGRPVPADEEVPQRAGGAPNEPGCGAGAKGRDAQNIRLWNGSWLQRPGRRWIHGPDIGSFRPPAP